MGRLFLLPLLPFHGEVFCTVAAHSRKNGKLTRLPALLRKLLIARKAPTALSGTEAITEHITSSADSSRAFSAASLFRCCRLSKSSVAFKEICGSGDLTNLATLAATSASVRPAASGIGFGKFNQSNNRSRTNGGITRASQGIAVAGIARNFCCR